MRRFPIVQELPGTVTDIDGNVYRTVKIGTQEWMAENLNVKHYRNGDSIPQVKDNDKWDARLTGAWCYYKNDPKNGKKSGMLYNWYAVNDPRRLAPTGWHIPSDKEWKILEKYLGMSQSDADAEGRRGTDEGGKMKEIDTTHWLSPNTGATNESGFSALPGGWRFLDGSFTPVGYSAGCWSSTKYNSSHPWAWARHLSWESSVVSRWRFSKRLGFSVRCVVRG